ncbi:hypothetical protein HHK36_017236 [Tetracentron sinense]|uniref:Bifunctional inhibitor/plant lipid transfer protein/seed storage helical domain-containing protein n=1 Tax=Tetracentron sinense TaxID=13715 RepID=A0A834YZ67_TETSI|nr:hypothetical protein HHK36_017236 [Tetracentron sinense]
MAVFKTHCIALAVLVVAGIVISGGRVSAQGCQGDLQGLISQCSQYVQKSGAKTPPSQPCCTVVKAVNIPCVCQYITKQVEQIISMEKVVYVAQYCGKTIPHGMKCGSYTVPKE